MPLKHSTNPLSKTRLCPHSKTNQRDATARLFRNGIGARLCKALVPEASLTVRANLMHYILLLCGYDIRPAFETTSGTPILLIPFDQMVYARAYLEMNGQRFYIFTPDLGKLQGDEARFRTPQFSAPMSELHNVDLVIRKPLNVKGDKHNYTLTQGGITVKGTVNERLMKMVYKYPQMPVPCYAQSVLDNDTRREVEEQIKTQIGTQASLSSVNRLLHFVQSAFAYATDDEQFGFENLTSSKNCSIIQSATAKIVRCSTPHCYVA